MKLFNFIIYIVDTTLLKLI